MSMPPRLGSSRRIGASTGSVTRQRNSPPLRTNGFCGLTTLNATSQDSTAEAIKTRRRG